MRRFAVAGLAALIIPAGVACAGLTETEPNDTMGTANAIARGAAPWADTGLMELGAGGGDVDFFSIELNENEVISIITTPLEDPFVDPDTMLGLFDSAGNEVAFNDDGGDGFGSALRYVVGSGEAGTYFIGVTGFNDRDFNGDHSEDGVYSLTIGIKEVPAPGALALLGVAGFAARRRRRA